MPLFTGNDSDGVIATASGQNWFTLEGEVVSHSFDAFDFSTFNGGSYTVLGTVISDFDAIVSDDASSGITVTIAETGFVFGDSDGIELFGVDHTVINNGTIVTLADAGIQLFRADSLTFGEVINNGTIEGDRGIVVEGGNTVVNNGFIAASDTGVELDGNGVAPENASQAGNLFINTGTVTGNIHGVSLCRRGPDTCDQFWGDRP